jgi:hypothetical protein
MHYQSYSSYHYLRLHKFLLFHVMIKDVNNYIVLKHVIGVKLHEILLIRVSDVVVVFSAHFKKFDVVH